MTKFSFAMSSFIRKPTARQGGYAFSKTDLLSKQLQLLEKLWNQIARKFIFTRAQLRLNCPPLELSYMPLELTVPHKFPFWHKAKNHCMTSQPTNRPGILQKRFCISYIGCCLTKCLKKKKREDKPINFFFKLVIPETNLCFDLLCICNLCMIHLFNIQKNSTIH